jgi:hypothetical protein
VGADPSPQECVEQPAADRPKSKDTGLTEGYRLSHYLRREPCEPMMATREVNSVRLGEIVPSLLS